MKSILILSTVILHNQLATSQVFRPQYTRPIAELENGKFINLPPNVIDPPSTNIIPVPKIIPAPRTTLITDCSPSICENLANTIQLMIVCNLLQNKYGSDCNNKLTLPVLNDFTAPALNNVIMPKIVNSNIPQSNIVGNYIPSSFFPNVIPSVPSVNPHNMILPSVIPPNMIPSNVIPPNLIPSNLITPNMIPSNLITPNMITPNMITPNMITPNVIPSNLITPGVIPPPVMPTAVSPACPNAQLGTANVNALLNTLMGMLGNIRG